MTEAQKAYWRMREENHAYYEKQYLEERDRAWGLSTTPKS